jgi:uncharacterized protein YkwD
MKPRSIRLVDWLLPLIAGLLVVSCVQRAVSVPPSAPAPALPPDTHAFADELFRLANEARIQHALPPLSLSEALANAAAMKAQDMTRYGYFAHVSPNGTVPWHWFKAVGYDYKYAAENLAWDYREPSDMHRAWMRSPKHRESILSPLSNEMAVVVTVTPDNRLLAVQLFGAQRESRAASPKQ